MSLIANNGLVCVGGPYAHHSILLECPKSGTLVFSVKGFTGRYVYHQCKSYSGKEPVLKWENH